MSDNLEKDPSIIHLLEELRAALGPEAFDIVDHWPLDLIAIGIASPRNHQVLVYLSVFDGGYYAELELPGDPDGDPPYHVSGTYSELSFDQLLNLVVKHLSFTS